MQLKLCSCFSWCFSDKQLLLAWVWIIWNLQLLKTFICASSLDCLYWHRVKTKALAVKLSVTTWRSYDEQDTEETKGNWRDVMCSGTNVILFARKTLRRPLPVLSFIRSLSCSGSWSFCYSNTMEWKGLKTSLLRGLWISYQWGKNECVRGNGVLLTYISRYVSTNQSWTWSWRVFIKYDYSIQSSCCEALWLVAWMMLQSRSREYQTKQIEVWWFNALMLTRSLETWLEIGQVLICWLACRISKSLGGAIVMQSSGFSCLR